MTEPVAADLLPHRTGRCLTAVRPIRITDVDPRGRLRLDAIARYLQDIANDDSMDAGFTDEAAMAWVVRRTVIVQLAPGHRRETVTAATWCGGLGRRWADRRTTLRGDRGQHIEASSIWVHVDPATGTPARFPEAFLELYAESAEGRKVSSKLVHPTAPDPTTGGITEHRWAIRRTDLDPWNHVNNAATWAIVEEHARPQLRATGFRAELEYRNALNGPDDATVTVQSSADANRLWINDAAGELVATALVSVTTP
ncbi:MAG: hypothetical protein HKN26_13565 [Acidimicrobiales bacterium]|nr:hypothetical protein [Acidimicrobiales bacterium]